MTDEDFDCIVQDTSSDGGAPIGPFQELAIDAIQKHVEESLLFLDEEKNKLEKRETKSVACNQKTNKVLEKPGSECNKLVYVDDTVIQDIDGSLKHVKMDANEINTGEPLKTVTDAMVNETLEQKTEITLPSDGNIASLVTVEHNPIFDTLLSEVDIAKNNPQEEKNNIPEQLETIDDNESLKDNPTSDSVLNKINKDTSMDDPQEVTSDITERIDTSEVIISQENNPPSDSAVHETVTGGIVNATNGNKASLASVEHTPTSDTVLNEVDDAKSNPQEVKNNISEQLETIDDNESLKGNPTSDSVLNKINKETSIDDPQEVTSDITQQIDTSKVIISQKINSPSDSAVNETVTDAMVNETLEQRTEITLPSDSNKASLVSDEHNPTFDTLLNEEDDVKNNPQEVKNNIPEQLDTIDDIVPLKGNPTSDSLLNKINKDTSKDDPQEGTSDITEQIDTSKAIMSLENNPPSDSAVVNDSLEQKCEIPQIIDCKKTNIESVEDDPTRDSVCEINTAAINNDSENKPNELLRQSDDNKVCNAALEDNPSSYSMLNETDTDLTMYHSELKSSDTVGAINGPQEETSDISEQVDINDIPQEDNNLLNETDMDAEMNDSQEILEQIEIQNVGNIYENKFLNETSTDVMNNDSLEGISDMSELNASNEVSMVSQENLPSDSVLNKSDTDKAMNDSQEEIDDMRTYNIDDCNTSEKTCAPLNTDFEKSDEVLHERCKIDNNTIETTDNCLDNLESINKKDHGQSIIDPVKDKILVESKKIYTTDEPTQSLENTSMEDKEHDNLPALDSNVEKSDLPEDEIKVEKEINETEKATANCLNNLESINKKDHGHSIIDPVKDKILVESKEIYTTDEPTQSLVNTSMEDKEHDNLPALDSNVEKSGLPEDEIKVENEINETEKATANCLNNLESINKKDHGHSIIETQKDKNFVESKEIYTTDEPTQSLENTSIEDKEHNNLPELDSNVQKSGLLEDEIKVDKEINETEKATQKSPEKELVWEIKSIKDEPENQEKKELLQNERSQKENVTENPTNKNPLVRAAPLEDVTECPPVKRPKLEPVWTTNPIDDEEKPDAGQVCQPYIISNEVRKQLHSWLLKCGLTQPKSKYMIRLIHDARWNKSVIRMAPIPKEYKPMDVFRIMRDETETYDKDITKRIQFIHINKLDENYNAAYIKWMDIDKPLVVKAFQILRFKKFTIDGAVKQPVFKYDNRSVVDWDAKERPILKEKCVDEESPKAVPTPALSPVVTPIVTVASTSVTQTVAAPVVQPAGTPVVTTRPKKPPPPRPFTTGEIHAKDRLTFGLSPAFMEYYKLKTPILNFIFAKNLDMSHGVEEYRRIFSAAGEITDIEEVPPLRHEEQVSLKLRITYNHSLEAVQAISMFHEQILFDRLVEMEIGSCSMKKRKFTIEGFSAVGPGLGVNGYVMKNIRTNIEISKLKARTKTQLDILKSQIGTLKQKFSEATFKLEQFKKEEEKRKFKEEKKQMRIQNVSQNKQANMDAMSAITTAIASSVQANVMGMLGIQPNQQAQNIEQNAPSGSLNQPGGMSQSQNTSNAPVSWTPTNNTPTALPNQIMQSSIENPYQNIGRDDHSYQNPQDPYNYYANMQQAYAQYGYIMDPTLMQANPYAQPGTPYMQPGHVNVHPVPPFETSNKLPTTLTAQSMPTIIPNQPVLTKPSNPTQSKVLTQSKTVFPPLPTTNKNVTVEIQKPPNRFDVPPANVGKKTAPPTRFDVPPANMVVNKVESKVPPLATTSQPAVKMAFKIQKPIIPQKVTKQATINIKIPSALPEVVPLVIPNPRTQDKNSVQNKLEKLTGKMPASQRVEPWINKQIRDMRKNSKSPESVKKSPDIYKSPDRSQKTLPKAIQHPKPVRRISRSPDRRIINRSPVRRKSRSPIRRRSRSFERKRLSRSPIRRRSRSPIKRRSRSNERKIIRKSPMRRISRSPIRRRSRSIERRRISRSPKRRISKSPIRRMSRSPVRRRSRSPKRGISKSPVRLIMAERKRVSRSRSSELGPKPTPRPAYEPDGVSRDLKNLELVDKTAFYSYERKMERELANTSVYFSYLPPSVSTEDLTEKMTEIGELLKVRAFGLGKAMVAFKFRQDAETCLELFNMAKVDGQTIEVRWASIE